MASAGFEFKQVGPLRVALAEAARTDEENAERTAVRFVELRPGHEETLRSRQHHLITGRRGTGKSTLLHVARGKLRAAQAPVAVIDMEKFKNRPFPDVLIEILITLLDELQPTLRLKTLLADVRLRRRFNRSRKRLSAMLEDPQSLNKQLSRESRSGRDSFKGMRGKAKGSMGEGTAELAGEARSESWRASAAASGESATYVEMKIERLEQLASSLSAELATLVSNSPSDRAAIFIDDYYYVRLADQPTVLDYLKTVTKGTGIWLKVGGVGGRLKPFQDGDPAIGMQPNQDIHPLAIDVTLDEFATAKRFLERMLDGVVEPLGLTAAKIFTDTARARMVVACGGAVARDYITLTQEALDVAVERLNRDGAPGPDTRLNIQAEDVNAAASRRITKKEDSDLTIDAGEDARNLRERWRDICDFARHQGDSAFVLVRQKDLDENDWGADVKQLENLRLLHRISDTVPNTPNWRGVKCVVFLIDLGQLAVKRLQTGIPNFWTSTAEFDKLRRAEWVYAPSWRERAEEKQRSAASSKPRKRVEAAVEEPLTLFDDPGSLG